MCEALIKTPAERAFKRTCQTAAASCLLVYITASQAALRVHGTLSVTLLAALSGAAFFGELLAVTFLMVRIRDEFQRTLLIQSFLWASAITMALTFIIGAVELDTHEAFGRTPIIFVPLLLITLTALAKVLIFRQHRSPKSSSE